MVKKKTTLELDHPVLKHHDTLTQFKWDKTLNLPIHSNLKVT